MHHKMLRRSATLILSLAAVAAMAPAGAHAAPNWLPAETISPTRTTGDFFSVDVSMNRRGDAVSSWRAFDGTTWHVYAAYRRAGGPWLAEKQLSTAEALAPKNTIDDEGRALVAWNEGNTIKLSATNASGTFGSVDTVSQAGAAGVQLAMEPAGNAVLVWLRGGIVEYLTRSASGTYSPPAGAQPLSAAGSSSLNVGVGTNGDIGVIWVRNGTVEATYRKAGEALFGTVQVLAGAAANISYGSPQIAVDQAGRGTAFWRRFDSSTTQYSLQTTDRTRTIPFGTGIPVLTPPAGESLEPGEMGTDATGSVYATWYHSVPGGLRIEAASKPANGSFGATQLVSASSGSADTPEIDVNDRGDVVIAWNRFVPQISTRIVEAKYRPAGQTFDAQPVTVLSSEEDMADYPDVAIDSAGNAVATHFRRPITVLDSWSVRSVGLDAAAPASAGFSVPDTATAGKAISVTSGWFDQWSTPSVKWTFGDGGTANGTSASHTYAAPGTYTVTATATDGVGNSTSRTHTVQVSAPPALDADGDGITVALDCDDTNPNIKPGTPEIPDNDVDENCDSIKAQTPPAKITSGVDYVFDYRSPRFTKVESLVVNNILAGSTIQVTCKGKGCTFSSKKKTFAKATKRFDAKGFFNFTKKVKKSKRKVVAKMKPGTKIELRITAPKTIGKVVTFTTLKAKRPTLAVTCLAPGAAKSTAC
jgi:PKD repeat protein